jgi:hypothetical protein
LDASVYAANKTLKYRARPTRLAAIRRMWRAEGLSALIEGAGSNDPGGLFIAVDGRATGSPNCAVTQISEKDDTNVPCLS